MGICPACGSFIDPGEVCCPDCGYIEIGGSISDEDETVIIRGDEYLLNDVEEALRDFGYDMYDLENDCIDEDDLENILDSLEKL